MTDVINRVTTHFNSKEPKIIPVEEWGEDGEPLKVYATPLTVHESTRLNAKLGKNPHLSELCVEVLLLKAKDADGNKMFKLEDKPKLMKHADMDVIMRVATEIAGGDFEDIEDEAKQNFKKPQS